jgi:mannose PTS system EIIA component
MSRVGIVLVGHGDTASHLLEAARSIVLPDSLDDVVAVDAGEGETPTLGDELCRVIRDADHGSGVLLIVDLLGASPCRCAERESAGHPFVVVSGLNLAMLLKLAALDRRASTAAEIAEACVDSGRRSVGLRAGGGADGEGKAEVVEGGG